MFYQHILNKKQTNNSQASGFTLIEVLAGILMATAFVLIASQAIAISAVYRIQALRKAEALLAIQDDLESVKFVSLQIPATQANCNTGYADTLIAALPATTNPTLLNKDYNLTRTTLEKSVDQPHVMTLSYAVTEPESGVVISELYTEVIPNAAFECN